MRRYLTPRCIGLHVTLLVVLPIFGLLTWWQAGRALGGNTLSWAYTFEWPLFAGYAVYMWWQLIHDVTWRARRTGSGTDGPSRAVAAGNEEDAALPPGWALGKPRAASLWHRGRSPDAGGTNRACEADDAAADDAADGSEGDAMAGDGADQDADREDAELAAYNRYLAQLNESGSRKSW